MGAGMSASRERWFDLAPLGFPGWEHSQATVSTTAGDSTLFCEVRAVGSNFSALLFDKGGGLFPAIRKHIAAVEKLALRRHP